MHLDQHLGSLARELEQGGYGRCTYLAHRELRIGINWKAGLENFAEFYHVPYVHTSVEGAHVGDSAAFDRFERHHRLLSGVGSLPDLSEQAAERAQDDSYLIVGYWIYPNLVVIQSSRTIDLVQFQPGADPHSCIMRHTSLARRPFLTEAERAGYDSLFEILTGVFTGEDATALERVGEGLAHTARDHLLIGRNEPGVQHMIQTLQAARLERGG
jgi:phenylpropionate dioxygenase-like ring-hydroxylating dioxygenase large terminal subunit